MSRSNHAGRKGHAEAYPALRRREVAGRARLPLRRLPRPPLPFYILDEVEAALDDANIDRFLQLVRRFSGRAQFVIVTHQKRTMDAADVLYGVTMSKGGITKVISRRLPRDVAAERLEEKAPAEVVEGGLSGCPRSLRARWRRMAGGVRPR